MQTIELSREVKADEPLVMVIPAVQLTEHIGAQARVVIEFDRPQTRKADIVEQILQGNSVAHLGLKTPAILARLDDTFEAEDVSLRDLLDGLRRERAEIWREKWAAEL